MSILICHTEGCVNAGIPIEMDLAYTDPDTGQQVTVSNVVCGPCGQPISDISDEPPPGDGEAQHRG